ncbi:MAG: hypothetical protein IKJ43_02805 [Bacilli bacterium]|nr:hypothetical protein [Bacilli bacterium]
MKIIIDNEKDLYKFYKKLPLYRSLFYKKVTFESNNENIKQIIKALNIKKRKERITYVYDTACKNIDNHYNNKNICGFKNNKCYVQQKLNDGNINGCCRWCLYQSNNGCKTSNLTCKLFTCSEVEKRCKVITFDDLSILKILTKRQRLIAKTNYFTKRESFIRDLYIGSFVVWEITQLIRFINIYIIIRSKRTSFK